MYQQSAINTFSRQPFLVQMQHQSFQQQPPFRRITQTSQIEPVSQKLNSYTYPYGQTNIVKRLKKNDQGEEHNFLSALMEENTALKQQIMEKKKELMRLKEEYNKTQ